MHSSSRSCDHQLTLLAPPLGMYQLGGPAPLVLSPLGWAVGRQIPAEDPELEAATVNWVLCVDHISREFRIVFEPDGPGRPNIDDWANYGRLRGKIPVLTRLVREAAPFPTEHWSVVLVVPWSPLDPYE